MIFMSLSKDELAGLVDKGSRTYKIWTDEEKSELLSLWDDGYNPKNISKMMGRTRISILSQLQRLRGVGNCSCGLPWTVEEDQILLNLRDGKGMTYVSIVDYLPGRSEHSVKGRYHFLRRGRSVAGRGSVVFNLLELVKILNSNRRDCCGLLDKYDLQHEDIPYLRRCLSNQGGGVLL
jgi:hypothetical protein